MEVATTTLEFLDREQKFYKESKEISVDMFGKGTNSFTYVLPGVCFPKNNIETLKLLLCVLYGYVILMKNLKSIVENMKTI